MRTKTLRFASNATIVWGLFFLSLDGSASAVETPPPALMRGPNSFDFVGAFECKGAFRGGIIHRSSFTGRSTAGGKWVQLDEGDEEPSTGYLASYLIGFDASRRRFVEFDANNSSAGFYFSTAGWQEHSLTMTSDQLNDPSLPYAKDRFVYTITGPATFSVDWQVIKPGGSDWLEGDHLECSRST